MTRIASRSALVVLFCLEFGAVVALAQGGGPATPVDTKDPAALATAYGLACAKADTEAALRLLAAEPQGQPKFGDVLADFPDGMGNVDPATFLRQFMLAPVLGAGAQTVGKPEIDGDTARVPVTLTLTVSQTYVMRKQPDGTWKLDLPETIKTTSGTRAWYLMQQEKAQQAECISNLKQLGLAALMFAQDHDETFPSAEKWTDELMPYMGDPGILKCPAAGGLECAYLFNANLGGRHLAEVANAAEVVLFFEGGDGTRNGSAKAMELGPKARHNGGYDFAFLDGHVKWVSAKDAPKLQFVPEIAKPAERKPTCPDHLRVLADAALKYAKDHEDTLPPAKTWSDDLKAYVNDDTVFQCVNEAGLPGGYAMNSKVAGKALAGIENPDKTVLFFETTSADRNAADPLDSLVPEGRHNGGNYFAYVDGHVKWLKIGARP